jgi:2-polyprenyl-3-methyl-5-hydroxy-6-metoxy-1,4-benzoquinol methylase
MINNSGIWDVEEAKKGHFHSLELARKLERVFTKRMPVLDLGCGLGFYAHHLSSKGFSVTAYEGTEGIHEISIFKQIITHDLTEPLPDSIKGQVLCMEVGEHIPKANEQQFIDNITAVDKL